MATKCFHILQGYISRNPNCVVRIRIADDIAFLTVKSHNFSLPHKDSKPDIRHEFEYKIPLDDAKQMIQLSEGTIIDKTRYIIPYKGFIWEVDEFHGANEGLTVAEIELKDSMQNYSLPPFIGENVTGNPKYYNSNL